jgi:hypothetical protein
VCVIWDQSDSSNRVEKVFLEIMGEILSTSLSCHINAYPALLRFVEFPMNSETNS